MKATLRKNKSFMVTVQVRFNLSLADILLAASYQEWYMRNTTKSLAEVLKRAKEEYESHGLNWKHNVEDDIQEIAKIALSYLQYFSVRLSLDFGLDSFNAAQKEIEEYIE